MTQSLYKAIQISVYYWLGDFEDPEQTQGTENGEAERAGLELAPNDLEDGPGYDDAVEPVEGRLEVDPRPECVHLDQHLADEQAEERVLRVIFKFK